MRSGEARLKFIRPQEPILILEPPVSDDWIHADFCAMAKKMGG